MRPVSHDLPENDFLKILVWNFLSEIIIISEECPIDPDNLTSWVKCRQKDIWRENNPSHDPLRVKFLAK